MDVRATHIDGFYHSIFSDGCKANTVIHYHALLSKAFKTAIKKKILLENPIEEVDCLKKNVYHATFYTVDEMKHSVKIPSTCPFRLQPTMDCIERGAWTEVGCNRLHK